MRKVALLLAFIILAVVLDGCLQRADVQGGVFEPVTEEESVQIAKRFLFSSPTYKFDGEDAKVVEVLTLRCPYCWEVVIEFRSRHGGYGDRTGQMVIQVITPHTARIVVKEGEVVSAILDEKWDELNQREVEKAVVVEEIGLPKGSEAAVRLAKEDLSKRIGVPVGEIKVARVTNVEWRDASLGCPEEGVMYAQVITPGFEMILSTNGRSYKYHSTYKNAVYRNSTSERID